MINHWSFAKKLMELDQKDAKALYQAGLCFKRKGKKTGDRPCAIKQLN